MDDLPFVNYVSKVPIDLLTLEDITKDLSVSEISPGNYTKIRLSIEAANVTYADSRWEPVEVPHGRIDIIVHFEI